MAAEKTTSTTFGEARDKAHIAVMDAITDAVSSLRSSDYRLGSHTGRIKDLAFAFRLMDGGAQPGSVEVSPK